MRTDLQKDLYNKASLIVIFNLLVVLIMYVVQSYSVNYRVAFGKAKIVLWSSHQMIGIHYFHNGDPNTNRVSIEKVILPDFDVFKTPAFYYDDLRGSNNFTLSTPILMFVLFFNIFFLLTCKFPQKPWNGISP